MKFCHDHTHRIIIAMSSLSSWQPPTPTHAWSTLAIGDFHNPSKCWITIPGQYAQFTRSDPHAKSPADADKCPTKRQKDEKCSKIVQKGKRSLQPTGQTSPWRGDLLSETDPTNAAKAEKEPKVPTSGKSFIPHFKLRSPLPLQPISSRMLNLLCLLPNSTWHDLFINSLACPSVGWSLKYKVLPNLMYSMHCILILMLSADGKKAQVKTHKNLDPKLDVPVPSENR